MERTRRVNSFYVSSVCGSAIKEDRMGALIRRCFAVVPSSRLDARSFGLILIHNGIDVRVVGRGSCTFSNSLGECFGAGRLLILTVPIDQLGRLELHSRMCSITLLPVKVAKEEVKCG